MVIADWDLAMTVRFLRNVEGIQADVQVKSCGWGAKRAARRCALPWSRARPSMSHPPCGSLACPTAISSRQQPPYLKISSQPAPYTRLDRQIDPQVMLEGVQRQDNLLVLRWLVVWLTAGRRLYHVCPLF